MEKIFLFILWIICCWIVGWQGSKRSIGYNWSIILSILLTPVIALVIVLFSKKKEDVAIQKELLGIKSNINSAEYLEKIFSLKEKGAISEEEYEKLKNEALNNKK